MGLFFIMQSHTHTFPKSEHLTGKIAIDNLFQQGEAFVVYPIRVVYKMVATNEENKTIQVLISVPKKRFKHAVDRNRYKRLIRESYRLNKEILKNHTNNADYQLHIAFCAVSNDIPTFDVLQQKMQKGLARLSEQLLLKQEKE